MMFYWERQQPTALRRSRPERGRLHRMAWVFLLLTLAHCSGKKSDMSGIVDERLSPCPDSPNCVSSQSEDPARFIEPLTYKGAPLVARQKLVQVLEGMKGVKIVTQKEHYIHATCTSRFIRFVDDLELYFVENEPIIHVRSASRVGYSDLGVNRRRVEKIRMAFASSN